MKRCPFCAEEIQDAAIVCRYCGRDQHRSMTTIQPAPTTVVVEPAGPRPGIAALLSLLIPGAGQLYRGRVVSGLAWFVVVAAGYFLFLLPGAVLHICCVAAAASGSSSPTIATVAPTTSAQTSPSWRSPVPQEPRGLATTIGRTAAVLAHPVVAWRANVGASRAVIVLAAVLILLVLAARIYLTP